MEITLDGELRYTSVEDVQERGFSAPDHEVWFRVHHDGERDEFLYLRASPRISRERMEEIIDRLLCQSQLAEAR